MTDNKFRRMLSHFVTSLSMSMRIRFCDDCILTSRFLKAVETFMRLCIIRIRKSVIDYM